MEEKYCMIEIAFGNKKEAKKAVEVLLDKKLVASCQLIKSNSVWNWKEEREKGKEYLMFGKTKESLQEEIFEEIKKTHSYETFEFAVFKLESCNIDYLNWIESQTK